MTWLTVYCRLQVAAAFDHVDRKLLLRKLAKTDRRAASSYKVIRFRFQLVGKKIDYGLFRDFWEVFVKNLSFSYASKYFSDFSGVKWHSAEAHAKGFASL